MEHLNIRNKWSIWRIYNLVAMFNSNMQEKGIEKVLHLVGA